MVGETKTFSDCVVTSVESKTKILHKTNQPSHLDAVKQDASLLCGSPCKQSHTSILTSSSRKPCFDIVEVSCLHSVTKAGSHLKSCCVKKRLPPGIFPWIAAVLSGLFYRSVKTSLQNLVAEKNALCSPDGFQLNNAARQFSSLALVQNVCASVDMKEAFCLHSSSQKQECFKSFAP